MHTSPPRRIVLACDASTEMGRCLVAGAQRFARASDDWLLQVVSPQALDSRALSHLAGTSRGLIVHLEDRTLAQALLRVPLPCVNTSSALAQSEMPAVVVNEYEVGRLAAEHLLDCGFRQLGVVSLAQTIGMDRREAGFSDALRKAGIARVSRFIPSAALGKSRGIEAMTRLNDELLRWLGSLGEGMGLLVESDAVGELVLDLCRLLGLDVPNDVGVLGVGNDAWCCDGALPALSSVVVPYERIGFEAARLLAATLDGMRAAHQPVLYRPLGVSARQSTDHRATTDPYVNQALEYIRGHADKPMNVSDVLEELPISRRSLEQRFQRTLGRSPLSEINRLRVENAKHLLVETDLKIREIAEVAGFPSPEQMVVVFRRQTGVTPTAYRALFLEGKEVMTDPPRQ